MSISSKTRTIRFGLAVVLAGFTGTVPARAETLSLLCSGMNGIYKFDIDLTNNSICMIPANYTGPCVKYPPPPVQITDREIRFGDNVIDRTTGLIRWQNGPPGTCRRAGQPL